METSIVTKQEVLGKHINVYGDIENPLFLAKDVASWLEHSDVSTMIHTVDDDEKVQMTNPNNACGGQGSWFLTENGLYEVFMLSRKPIAKQLKRGIKEMLHSVRLHGAYMTDDAIERTLTDPDYLIQLATTLKVEKQKRLEAERKIEEQKSLVVFAGAVESSKTSILIGELATILKQNGINIGEKRLYEWMRGNGYLIQYGDRKNRPTQKSMDMDLFEVLERTIQRGSEKPRITRTTKVTGKGQVYFVNKFLNR